MGIKKLMSYEDVLAKHPDWLVINTNVYRQEETPELTEQSRQRVKRKLGVYLKFLQDHGLVRKTLCESVPTIPDEFKVYLRDLTPEGYELHRTGYQKWLDYLDRSIDSDPANIKALEKALTKLRAAGAHRED